MSDCFFSQRTPIEVAITISYQIAIKYVTYTLHKIAESRFDGQNTKYVNDLQPELDFDIDDILFNKYYSEAVSNIVRRIEPYVVSYEQDSGQGSEQQEQEDDGRSLFTNNVLLNLRFPYNWKSIEEGVLQTKIEDYVSQYIIAQWLEKVSMQDTNYSVAKAEKLLRDIKGVCELRNCRVHRVYNGTY